MEEKNTYTVDQFLDAVEKENSSMASALYTEDYDEVLDILMDGLEES